MSYSGNEPGQELEADKKLSRHGAFVAKGGEDAHISRIHRLSQFRENAELMADEGSIDGRILRGRRLNSHHQETARRAASNGRGKSTAVDVLFLELLDQHLADIEGGLVETYGDAFFEKIAAKYLDEETFERLMTIEDPEERKAAMRHELAKRYREGEITIEEEDVRDWLDTYNDYTRDKQQELDAHFSGQAQSDDPRIIFEAAAKGADHSQKDMDLANNQTERGTEVTEAIDPNTGINNENAGAILHH